MSLRTQTYARENIRARKCRLVFDTKRTFSDHCVNLARHVFFRPQFETTGRPHRPPFEDSGPLALEPRPVGIRSEPEWPRLTCWS